MNHCPVLVSLVVLGAMVTASTSLVDAAANDTLTVGIHTIRADDELLQRARDGGFTWLIQLLEWREIEPVPGEYFWEYADWLVRAAQYYGLDLVLRLDHPPEWSAPVDVSSYAAFAGRVAARYRGRVAAYVIWNEPNLAAEWEGHRPDAVAYTELLCAAHAAIRAADSQALVVSAGLAPTNQTDHSALDDRLYLQAMYDAGAAACFDLLGAHPYGFAYPPDDPAGAHEGLNFARLADLRAIMVEQGDGSKPIWVTELGWTTEPVGAERRWLQVSEEEQARYLLGAIEQARRDWPWLERIAIWNASLGLAREDERRGYSILADDGTPKPAYQALAERLEERGTRKPGDQRPVGEVEVLAPDVVVRLSDVDTYYSHWARPHCGSAPCRSWSGQFYIWNPGTASWRLRMEIMQLEEPGNLVWINGRLLDPPAIPLRDRPDYTSVWTVVETAVPAILLQPGVNTIKIHASPRLPVYQDSRARYESLQLRNLRFLSDS